MKATKITTTDYFMIGWRAYFADKVWDFMVLRDRDPWQVFYREAQMPMMYLPETPGLIKIGEEAGWVPVKIDGKKVENYFKRYAKPDTWSKVSTKFYETHKVACICDGPTLSVDFTKSNGTIKHLVYLMHEFPEEWHPSYQKACRLMRYLERQAGTAKKSYAFFGSM